MNLPRLPKRANRIATINHDLKSQLFSMKAYIQLLERKLKKQDAQGLFQYVERVDTQIDKFSFALSDFIDYVRITEKAYTLHQEFLHIDEVVAQTSTIFLNLFPHTTILTKGTITKDIFADRNKLEKVFYSLFLNAVMYNENHPIISISFEETKKNVTVSVKDNGFGMEKKNLPHIFEPFYCIPLENFNDRPGLGLFVAKKIIDLHGGKIHVTSTPKKGTIFTITLPI